VISSGYHTDMLGRPRHGNVARTLTAGAKLLVQPFSLGHCTSSAFHWLRSGKHPLGQGALVNYVDR